MHQRLEELKRELEIGLERMSQLERNRAELRDKLLRISGAIQVLEELTAETPVEAGRAA